VGLVVSAGIDSVRFEMRGRNNSACENVRIQRERWFSRLVQILVCGFWAVNRQRKCVADWLGPLSAYQTRMWVTRTPTRPGFQSVSVSCNAPRCAFCAPTIYNEVEPYIVRSTL